MPTTSLVRYPSTGFRAGFQTVCKDTALPPEVRAHLSAALPGAEKKSDAELQTHVLSYISAHKQVKVKSGDSEQVYNLGFKMSSEYSSVTATIDGVKGYSYNGRIDP